MTDVVTISIISGASTVVVASIAGYFAYRAAKVAEATHKAVNSRMDNFLKMAEKSFKAQGKLEATEEQKAKDG